MLYPEKFFNFSELLFTALLQSSLGIGKLTKIRFKAILEILRIFILELKGIRRS